MRHRAVSLMVWPLALLGCTAGGFGIVTDSESGATIPDATITVDCYKQSGIEGTEKIYELHSRSDESGRYSISGPSIWRCYDAVAYASKPGYVSLQRTDFQLQRDLWLTPESEAIMHQLKYWEVMSRGTSSTRFSGYTWVFDSFIEAKWLAVTSREVAFVRDSFCSRLISQYDQLSEDEKARLLTIRVSAHSTLMDHTLEVLSYCNAAPR